MPYTEIDHFIAKMRVPCGISTFDRRIARVRLGCGLEMAFLDFAEDKIARGVASTIRWRAGPTGAGSGFMPTCGRLPLMTGSSITS